MKTILIWAWSTIQAELMTHPDARQDEVWDSLTVWQVITGCLRVLPLMFLLFVVALCCRLKPELWDELKN
jgi:hypothetical protein